MPDHAGEEDGPRVLEWLHEVYEAVVEPAAEHTAEHIVGRALGYAADESDYWAGVAVVYHHLAGLAGLSEALDPEASIDKRVEGGLGFVASGAESVGVALKAGGAESAAAMAEGVAAAATRISIAATAQIEFLKILAIPYVHSANVMAERGRELGGSTGFSAGILHLDPQWVREHLLQPYMPIPGFDDNEHVYGAGYVHAFTQEYLKARELSPAANATYRECLSSVFAAENFHYHELPMDSANERIEDHVDYLAHASSMARSACLGYAAAETSSHRENASPGEAAIASGPHVSSAHPMIEYAAPDHGSPQPAGTFSMVTDAESRIVDATASPFVPAPLATDSGPHTQPAGAADPPAGAGAHPHGGGGSHPQNPAGAVADTAGPAADAHGGVGLTDQHPAGTVQHVAAPTADAHGGVGLTDQHPAGTVQHVAGPTADAHGGVGLTDQHPAPMGGYHVVGDLHGGGSVDREGGGYAATASHQAPAPEHHQPVQQEHHQQVPQHQEVQHPGGPP